MGTTTRVLVVEDEAVVALDIADGLKGLGYEVVGVVDEAQQAMKKAQELRPDVVLMDVMLKGPMDGIAAAGFIHDNLHLPVVFLTAHADEATLQRAKLSQPYGYILKPFEIPELRTSIELTLHRHAMDEKAVGRSPQRDEEQQFTFDVAEGEQGKVDFLRRVKLFSSISDEELTSLAAVCSFRRFDVGEFILHEGEEANGGFIVVSGRVAMIKTSPGGKDLIVELLPPADVFGLVYALSETPHAESARAQTPSQVLWVPKSMMRMVFDRHPMLYRQFNEEISKRLRTSHDLSRRLAHSRVEVRIVATLLALVPRFAKGAEDNLRIQITRRELADLTGTSPETAIRVTKNLERDNLLDLTRPGVVKIVDLKGLEQLALEEAQ